VDAFSGPLGAVLTSYVGISGLVHRMTVDQCFSAVPPQGHTPRQLSSDHPGLYDPLHLHPLSDAGTAPFSGRRLYDFLPGVMTFFRHRHILLKVNRSELKRTYRAGWGTVLLGALATIAGIIGNLVIDFRFLGYFAIYFIPAVVGGMLMYFRIPMLKGMLILIDRSLERISQWRLGVHEKIAEIRSVRAVVFVGLERCRASLRRLTTSTAMKTATIFWFSASIRRKIRRMT